VTVNVSQTMPGANTLSEVLGSLRAATREPAKLPEAIRALQAMVWKSKGWKSGLPEEVVETLADLAYDLDFYEPDAAARAQDGSYFAEDRALEEIADALRRINRHYAP
jgi:hypothetical protein